MFVSSKERREKLQLFNVSEAARMFGIGVSKLHRKIRDNELPRPSFQLNQTVYYDETSIKALKKAIAKMD
ncbi:helix-turn-helix domain-containing protein [Mariniblastus sp.]|nr:helix-turn-helix domain-containing protein [Mariniblastus sp.]